MTQVIKYYIFFPFPTYLGTLTFYHEIGSAFINEGSDREGTKVPTTTTILFKQGGRSPPPLSFQEMDGDILSDKSLDALQLKKKKEEGKYQGIEVKEHVVIVDDFSFLGIQSSFFEKNSILPLKQNALISSMHHIVLKP